MQATEPFVARALNALDRAGSSMCRYTLPPALLRSHFRLNCSVQRGSNWCDRRRCPSLARATLSASSMRPGSYRLLACSLLPFHFVYFASLLCRVVRTTEFSTMAKYELRCRKTENTKIVCQQVYFQFSTDDGRQRLALSQRVVVTKTPWYLFVVVIVERVCHESQYKLRYSLHQGDLRYKETNEDVGRICFIERINSVDVYCW
jgi:hypothetical protein